MNRVITIGREFGSGGKYIGEKLAERLGMKLYDKELLQKVAEEQNIDIHLLEEVDEKQRKSFWYTMAMASYSSTDSVNSLTSIPNNEAYFIEEARMIEKLAKTEDCIIIGRCSNIILKDFKNVTNVFVYAEDMDFKIQRKIKYGNSDEKTVKKLIYKTDKQRASYYNYFTNEKWGDKKNYDLCIDTSKIGVDKTVDLIESYIKIKESK